MHHFHFISTLPQSLPDVFGNHDRAMLPSGAAETDRQIALSLANVMREEVDEEIRDATDEFLRLRKRPDVLGDTRMPSCQRPELGYKVRIGQEANVEHQVSVVGHSMFESEAHARNKNGVTRARLLLEAVGQMGAQLVDVKFRGINDQVGNCANRPEV